ncbi:MAG: hypothetical protein CMJ96_02080 [Planctomycetes bacterium]|nr:hypothetical protein [Planctomycetota bacterium]
MGGAERAVLRLSGRNAFGAVGLSAQTSRQSLNAELEWEEGCLVPVSLLLFPGPFSATGEDVAEIHLPGSEPVVRGLLSRLLQEGARLAEPGEFTRRAFLNGRMDLVQAEAVADLVSSRSEAQAKEAVQLLSGEMASNVQSARDSIVAAMTELEAGLDFEEGDSQDIQTTELDAFFDQAIQSLQSGIQFRNLDSTPSSVFRVLMAGPSNAGKSTLFNFLTQSQALVSEHKGTTRDCLEASWGLAKTTEISLGDLPGLESQAADARDRVAQERATIERADLWLLCLDSNESSPSKAWFERKWNAPVLLVWTKADLPLRVSQSAQDEFQCRFQAVKVSSESGFGISDLENKVREAWRKGAAGMESRASAKARQQQALAAALEYVQKANSLRRSGGPPDCIAEELRAAIRPLGELVGEWTPEDLLDQIFSRFCIGK